MEQKDLNELVELLHNGKYSCVIANHGLVRTFQRRGVADLFDLLEHEPEYLKGAILADKVVGKAAAALMALGGVTIMHADVMSQPALTLLQEAQIEVDCPTIVPHIINRAGTGWCPLESASRDLHSTQEILDVVRLFISQQQQQA